MNTLNLNEVKTRKDSSDSSNEFFAEYALPENDSGDQARHTAPTPLYGEKAGLYSLFKDSIKTLLLNPPRLTALILALALTIPAAIAIMSTGFISAEKNLLDSRHFTVFLSNKTGEATQLAKTLAENKHIIAAELRTIDLQNKEVLALDVHPAASLGKRQLSFIVDELNSHTLVDYVAADLGWLECNVEAIETTRELRLISIVVAGLITAVIVFLLTRSELPGQKSDLRALNQLGASRKMLQKPLMLRSMLLTLAAGMIGTLLAWVAVTNLPNIVEMSTYEQILPRSFPAASVISLIILAIFCSFLTVRVLVRLR